MAQKDNTVSALLLLGGAVVAIGIAAKNKRRNTDASVQGQLPRAVTFGKPTDVSSLGSGFTGIGRTEVFPVTADSFKSVEGVTAQMLIAAKTSASLEIVAERIITGAGLRFAPTGDVAIVLHKFVNEGLPFLPDPPDFEHMIDPDDLAKMILVGELPPSLDCDDKAMFLAALYRIVGFESTVCFMDTSGNGEIDHAITQVVVPEQGTLMAEVTLPGKPLGWSPEARKVECLVLD